MKLSHEVALTTESHDRIDRAALAVHHAAHDGARMVAVGLAVLGVCLVVAALIRRSKGE